MRSEAKRSVLGIDAAWTATNPSGVALVAEENSAWQLVRVSASYDQFLSPTDPEPRPMGSLLNVPAILSCCQSLLGSYPQIVALDMPLSQRPIGGRRESDNAVSRTYGGRKCSTHTPTAQRPGPISDLLRAQFESEGYQLGTLTLGQRAIIEVYPHPALVELTGAAERLPYKAQKAAKFWPDLTPPERRFRTLEVWREIRSHLNQVITGVQSALPVPDTSAPAWQFKAFEDQLDAVVCAWVGVCALEDRAQPFGDSDSAIWIPTPDARI